MAGRPNHFEAPIPDLDYVAVLDVLVGNFGRNVGAVAIKGRPHPFVVGGWNSVALEEQHRLRRTLRHRGHAQDARHLFLLQLMQIHLRAAAPLDCRGGAEMVGMMMGSEQDVDVFDADIQRCQRLFERLDAVGKVHPRVDQGPLTMAIYQPDVDYGRARRKREENLVNSGMYFYDFRTHLLGPRQDAGSATCRLTRIRHVTRAVLPWREASRPRGLSPPHSRHGCQQSRSRCTKRGIKQFSVPIVGESHHRPRKPCHSCNDSVTLKVHFTVTFHLATRLSAISASTLVTRAEWIPVIVTLARVIASCTASSIELAEIPVKTIVFSTILNCFRV